MFGLIVFFAIGLYLALSAFAVWFATRWAKRSDRSPWRWGILTAFVMYNLVFWDWIPTVVAHNYYCEKEAGFTVYKTLEQWKAENPGVMEKLITGEGTIKRMPYGDLQTLDERFAIETRRRTPIPLLPTKIFEDLLVDRKTGEVLARGIGVGSGYGNLALGANSWREYKFWLGQEPCIANGIWAISTELQKMRGKK